MWVGFCITSFHFFIMFKLYEGSIHTIGSIPLLPEFRSVCSMENAVDARSPISLTECLDWCNKTSVCVMINYNSYSKLCVLKDTGSPTPAPGGRCVSMAVSSNTTVSNTASITHNTTGTNSTNTTTVTTTVDPCATRPCGITSLCVPSEISSYGFGYVCMPIYCPVPPTIQNTVSLSNILRKSGESDVYHCKPRYSGFHDRPNINCTGNGTLTETGYTCYPDCPSVPILTTADVKISPRTPYINNTVIHYECKPGFYNITPAVSTCDDKGRWSHFKCLPHCYYDILPTITNGEILYDNLYTINKPAVIVCNTNYYLSHGQPNITCNADGSWSSPVSTCYKYCPTPPNPTNGYIRYDNLYTINKPAEIVCNTSYYLSHGQPNITCNADGSWSSPVSTCYKYCPTPPNPTHGYITSTYPVTQLKNGTKAGYNCYPGYYHYPFNIPGEAVCDEAGVWSYKTSCYRYCGDPPPDEHLTKGRDFLYTTTGPPYTVDSSAKYKCITSTFLDGPMTDTLHCNAQGNWDGMVVCCFLTHSYNHDSGRCEFGK